jgi:hypothetical protein
MKYILFFSILCLPLEAFAGHITKEGQLYGSDLIVDGVRNILNCKSFPIGTIQDTGTWAFDGKQVSETADPYALLDNPVYNPCAGPAPTPDR